MRLIDEWKKDFKGYINALNMPKDDYDGIMEYVDELPSAQQWIPCSERLPKSKPEDLEYPVVAVCLDDGSVITACYYESTETWGCGEYYDRFCYPVAWMPLPEPARLEETDG